MPGYYALYVGGDFEGTRLSQRLLDKVALADIPDTLEPLFADFARHRNIGEGFGNFCYRAGAEHVQRLVQDNVRSLPQAAESQLCATCGYKEFPPNLEIACPLGLAPRTREPPLFFPPARLRQLLKRRELENGFK